MIKIGDKVKFLDDVGGGIVKGFIGKNMANVENEDGFEIPYPVSMLINVDDPLLTRESSKKEEIVQPEVVETVSKRDSGGMILEGRDSPDFYFCFVPYDPQKPLERDIELFFINDSNYNLLVRYAHLKERSFQTLFYGKIVSNSKILLESIGQNDLADLPEYIFQVIYFRDDETDWRQPFSQKIRISPVKFYKESSYQFYDFLGQKALVLRVTENILQGEPYKLTDEDFKKVLKDKEIRQEKKVFQVKKVPEIIEIDLHINELIDNTAGLSNKDILDIQINKVEQEMRSAIPSASKRIVFIHGVGQGILKQEISKLLKKKFPKYSFHDASFKEYGYGATMVILKKK